MTYSKKHLINYCTELLKKKKIKNPRYESILILSQTLKKNFLEIFYNDSIKLNKKEIKKYLRRVYQRTLLKPISRINGKREFYSRNFFISKYVLDPRPESETLVSVVKRIIENSSKKSLKILELGVGSGCLIISVFLESKNKFLTGLGVDVSDRAINLAKKNLNKYDLANSLEIKKSNWFSNVEKKFDLIISNPPYLDSDEINFLDDEVKKYDPLISLDGGKNGLECYKNISKDIWKYLNVGGMVCLEIGFNQSEALQSIFERQGLVKVFTKKDLLNKDRVIVFKK
tara:strand:- start:467 stop:1324 length:858 start_codon:yes stop_codon:yes gene_type:complete